MEIIQFQEAISNNEFCLPKGMDVSPIEPKTKPISSFQHMNNLPNGFAINQYFERYLRTQFILAAALLINICFTLIYCELSLVNKPMKDWFLRVGYYFHFFCIILSILNFKTFNDYKISEHQTQNKQSIGRLAFRIFLLLLKPSPYLDSYTIDLESISNFQTHSVNNILSMLSLNQIFLVFRVIYVSSKQKTARASRVCKMYGTQANIMYTIRCWFTRNTLFRIILMFFIWFLVCTFSIRIGESAYNKKISSLENALWLTFSTMFCVGFGDIFPKTDLGKWIALAGMYTGVIMIYIAITWIRNTFQLNSRQKRALRILTSLQKKNELKIAASHYIRQSLNRVWRNKKARIESQLRQSLLQIQLKKAFKMQRMRCRTSNIQFTVIDQFTRNFEKTVGYIDNLKSNNERLINYVQASIAKSQK